MSLLYNLSGILLLYKDLIRMQFGTDRRRSARITQ